MGLLAALVIGAALVGCGSGGRASTANEVARRQTGPSSQVSTGRPGEGRRILVNEWGYTLYAFSQDASGHPTCYGACARVWRPFTTVGPPKVWEEARVAATLLTTVKRSGGSLQVSYDGHPLYLYRKDKSAQATGVGKKSFGGQWFAVGPSGEEIARRGSRPS